MSDLELSSTLPIEVINYARDIVKINPINIDNDLATLPSYYFYFVELNSKVIRAIEIQEQALTVAEAQAATKLKGTKVSEARYEIRLDSRVQEISHTLISLREHKSFYSGVLQALEMKSRMVMSINKRDASNKEQYQNS